MGTCWYEHNDFVNTWLNMKFICGNGMDEIFNIVNFLMLVLLLIILIIIQPIYNQHTPCIQLLVSWLNLGVFQNNSLYLSTNYHLTS
jgi:hypothetical protein